MIDGDSVFHSVRDRVRTSRRIDRSSENRVKRWLLFDGSRERVATALLAAVFATLLVLGGIWPIEYQELLSETTMVQTVFNTLLSGTILLVSIVVSIAAVGISQELTSLGDQSERVDTVIDFQSGIEERDIVDVSPARPGASSPPSSSGRSRSERPNSSASTATPGGSTATRSTASRLTSRRTRRRC